MGGQQSKEKTTEILNDTNVQIALRNANESINEMTMNIVQEILMKTAASAKVKQEVIIEGVKTEGDITISGVSQKANVQISVSSLTNSELQQDLINETMNELQTKLTENMKLSQESALKQGEQMISGLINAVAGTIQGVGASVTGTNTSSTEKLSMKNLLNIESDTELSNLVKNAVSTDIINKTINEISNNLVGEQTVSIKNAETKGAIAITNIEQDILSNQILEAISNVGTSSEIISTLANTSVADIQKSIETGQEAIDEKQGTIDAAGDFVTSVGNAWTNFLQSGVLAVLLPVLIIGAIVLFMFRGVISQVAAKKAGVNYQPQPQYVMTGGAKPLKSLWKNIIKILLTIQKIIIKYYKKYFTKEKIMIIGVLLIITSILFLLYRKIRYTRIGENFTNEDKLSNLVISHNDKYLSNQKLGETKMCFKMDKERAFNFDVSITENDIYIVSIIGDEKLYMKNQDNEIVLENYDFANDKLYKFKYEKIKDNIYKLKQGEQYIMIVDNCLVMGPKDKSVELKFE
jgi:hypothetical protein